MKNLQLPKSLKVHEFSARGAWVTFLKRQFTEVSLSEYWEDIPLGDYKNGVRCEDVQQLTFEDEAFDLITSIEVFEHVPDDVKGYQEVWRILKPKGIFFFTVPLYEMPSTKQRAKLVDGKVVHLLEPEYHGDPIRPDTGILAYRNYGLDIVPLLESVGFRNVKIHRIRNIKKGIDPLKRVIVCEK